MSCSRSGVPCPLTFAEEMNLRCRHCGTVLARRLEPVESIFQLIFDCQHDVVPSRRYVIGDGSYSELTKNHVIVHLDDISGLGHPPNDEYRGYGCCGYWDDKGCNLVCVCGAEIGYELSDCCAPRMAHFRPSDVILDREQTVDGNPDPVSS